MRTTTRRDGRRGFLAAAALLAALASAAALAPAADAYRLGGKRWPGRTITYHNAATSYAWAVNEAVVAWNASGARIRFVKTTKARAKLLIKVARPRFGEAGSADLGYVGCTYWINGRCVKRRKGMVKLSPGYDRWDMVRVAAHELGHILGLDHEDRRCAVMNSAGSAWGGERCYDDIQPGKWRCRVLELDDIQGAVRRYGGRARAPRPEPYCWIHAAPPPPLDLSASANPASGANARLGWRNAAGLRQGSKVVVARGAGACPSAPEGAAWRWEQVVEAGTSSSTEDAEELLAPGRYCYAAWTVDEHGQRSGVATVWVDVADLFTAPTELVAEQHPAEGGTILLRWRNSSHPSVDGVRILRRAGSCATAPNDPAATVIDAWRSFAGEVATAVDGDTLTTGRYCYSVWAKSGGSRLSALPATVIVDYMDTLTPPTELAAVQNPSWDVTVRLTWRNTAHARLDGVRIVRRAGTCATDPADPAASEVFAGEVAPGQTSSADDWHDLSTGRYCYTLWSEDAGRRSAHAATIFVDYVAP